MKGLVLGIVAFLTAVAVGVANSDASSTLRRGAGCTGCNGTAVAAPSCSGKTVVAVPVRTVPVQIVKKQIVNVPMEVTTVETQNVMLTAACKAERVGVLDRLAIRRAEGKAKRAARRNVVVGACATTTVVGTPVAATTCDVDDVAPEMGTKALPPLPEVPLAPKSSSDL